MPKKSEDTVHILEGTAVLFKRPLTPHWQVRFKAKNKWQRVTTKCEDLDQAKKKAVEIVQEAFYRDRLNLPVVNKKFKSVAQRAIRRMEDLTKSGQGKASFKHYIQALNNYLIPFLGNHNIDRIDGALLNELSAWRVKKMNLVPKASWRTTIILSAQRQLS